jgi:outer membrane protein assembly factor BamB
MNRILLAVLLIPLIAINVTAQSSWTMGDKDRERTSWVQEDTEFAPPLTMKTYDFPEPLASAMGFRVYHSAYVGGVVYFGIGAGPVGNAVTAFDYKTGRTLWTTTILGGGGSIGNDPVVFGNSVISGGQGAGAMLTGINRHSGAVLWQKKVGTMYGRNATLDGTRLYVCTDSVYCLNPENGKAHWVRENYNTQGGTPALNSKYLAHVRLFSLYVRDKATGGVRWTRDGVSREGLTVDEQRVYVAANDSVLAFDIETGAEAWKHAVPEKMNIGFGSYNDLARDNKTLVYSIWEDNNEKGTIRALDLNTGAVKWTYKSEVSGIVSLTIINNLLYTVEWGNHTLLALDMDDGSIVMRLTGALFRTKVIHGDGRLYIGYENDPAVGAGLAVLSSATTSVGEVSIPVAHELHVYPNPVSSSTTISYTLDAGADVTLQIFDALGRRVAELQEGRLDKGAHTLQLTSGHLPAHLPGGVYTVILKAGQTLQHKNIVVVR